MKDMSRLARADVDRALRMLIGQRHHDACEARRRKELPGTIAVRDKLYEQALDTYREVLGKEPTVGGSG